MVHGIRKALGENLGQIKYKGQQVDVSYVAGVKYFKRPSDNDQYYLEEKNEKIKPKVLVIKDIDYVANAQTLTTPQLKTQMEQQKKKFEFTPEFAALTLEDPFKFKSSSGQQMEATQKESVVYDLGHDDIEKDDKFCLPLCESLRETATSDTQQARTQIKHYTCPNFDTDFWKKNKCSEDEMCSEHCMHCVKEPKLLVNPNKQCTNANVKTACGRSNYVCTSSKCKYQATPCQTNGLPDQTKCSKQKDQYGYEAKHCHLYSKTCVASKKEWEAKSPKHKEAKKLRSLERQQQENPRRDLKALLSRNKSQKKTQVEQMCQENDEC